MNATEDIPPPPIWQKPFEEMPSLWPFPTYKSQPFKPKPKPHQPYPGESLL